MLRLRRLFQQRREKRRLSACKAHAVSGTPAAFRAGAAKPKRRACALLRGLPKWEKVRWEV